MGFGRTLILKAAGLKPVEKLVRNSFLFRPMVSRFIAGDTLEESLSACEQLLGTGQRITLDYLGENTHSEAEALASCATYAEMLERVDRVAAVTTWKQAHEGKEPLNISIKLTQCGLDQGTEFAETNYRKVVQQAAALDNFVRIDMESSEYTQRTIDIVSRVHMEFPNTGTVLQSYLHRNADDVEFMIQNQIRIRIVKGAYLEPSSVAYPQKSIVDEKFVEQSKRLLSAGNYPAIATQDEAIIKELLTYIADERIDKKSFEFQMLFGIRRDLQQSLVADGYNVRVYVPYGDAWYPYFTRRLAERPANAFFIIKAMFKK